MPALALRDAGEHERRRVGREPARERGQGEREQADAEHPPPPERVAEAATEHEQHREGDAVARDDHLEGRARGLQVGVDRGEGDVDDEEVDDVEGRAHEERQQSGGGQPGTRSYGDGLHDDHAPRGLRVVPERGCSGISTTR
jgi:hypothetical protein